MAPLVSFIVPCYKLAYLLQGSVGSSLEQTFEDLEVLIMDDCSPDETPDVARSFGDSRVYHIRHAENLGNHVRNYNAGLARARGRYVWLISADDRLRRPYVLSRFVDALESHPSAAYVFCPAMKFNEDGDTGAYGSIGGTD